jgi:hypothetical protein
MAHATQGWTVAHGHEKLPLRATVVLPEALGTITFCTEQNRLLQLWGYPSGKSLCVYTDACQWDRSIFSVRLFR